MLVGQFSPDGKQFFSHQDSRPSDTRKLQAGMFIDRPDLWRKPSRKSKPVSHFQLILIKENNTNGEN